MIFALLTLLAALSLAAVAGWFSIVGFMAIYAGAPIYALIMGVVTECAKLVTTSWLYRNWQHAGWRLKAPLIYFTLALMTATSIGVFGFLSKAHLEQGAGTIDNSARIEQLQYQIDREKATIADNEKVTKQLDDTVNSLLGKDRADRALSVRKRQASQRAQLRTDSAEAQKRIDGLNAEKFKLESEVRKMQLDVGPIRYIAELFYGVDENATKNIEAAVRIFTLLLVSTLDPLAVILLIAANHTLIRIRNEEKEEDKTPRAGFFSSFRKTPSTDQNSSQEIKIPHEIPTELFAERIHEPETFVPTSSTRIEETALDVSIPQETVELLDEGKIISPGPQEISFPQIIDVIEGNSTVSNGKIVPETEVTEDLVGIQQVKTPVQDSTISTEVQNQVPSTDEIILNEEQEFVSEGTEETKIVPQEAPNDIWRATAVVVDNGQSSAIASEAMDQTEADARIAETTEILPPVQIDEKETEILENFTPKASVVAEIPVVRTPTLSRIGIGSEDVSSTGVSSVSVNRVPWAQQDTVLRELLGNLPHFAPQRLNEKEIVSRSTEQEEKPRTEIEVPTPEAITTEVKTLHSKESPSTEKASNDEENRKNVLFGTGKDKYPKALSWLTEFRRL